MHSKSYFSGPCLSTFFIKRRIENFYMEVGFEDLKPTKIHKTVIYRESFIIYLK